MPPDFGYMVASSAQVRAPQSEIAPPATQRTRISVGLPICLAISGGVRKMPLPMMMPTMIADAPQKPMRRGRSPGRGGVGDALVGGSGTEAAGLFIAPCQPLVTSHPGSDPDDFAGRWGRA